jgi:tRNA 2-thiouridine synthesizing protein A
VVTGDVSGDGPVVVDARGRLCPLPVIDLARAARDAAAGTTVALLADDPAAVGDVAAWCRMRGHTLTSTSEPDADGARRFVVLLAG